MNLTDQNELEFNFPIENLSIQTQPNSPALVKRKYDRTLFAKGAQVRAKLEGELEQSLKAKLDQMPDAPKGMVYRLKVVAFARATPGSSNVLRELINLVLSQRGASMTQTACREAVQANYPEHAVYKDWTKELPTWAFAYAKKRILGSAEPIASLKLKKGAALRDLHMAAKVALSKSDNDALTAKVSITISSDSVMINGCAFKKTNNKSNGKIYEVVRINLPALMKALNT